MRPHYETQVDLANEYAIIRYVSELWDFEPVKLPDELRIDYKGLRGGKLAMFCEVKKRKKRYDTLMINYSKIEAGLDFEKQSGWPFYLLIGWPDGVFYLRVKEDRIDRICMGQRKNEPEMLVAHFNVDRFRKVTP